MSSMGHAIHMDAYELMDITADEHRKEACRLLVHADHQWGVDQANGMYFLARAQVHATLATMPDRTQS